MLVKHVIFDISLTTDAQQGVFLCNISTCKCTMVVTQCPHHDILGMWTIDRKRGDSASS